MYGWTDAKNGEVPHENAKKGERETKYFEKMNGPTDIEGAFVHGWVYSVIFVVILLNISTRATSYSEGWRAQKILM
jgi:hypothetical protein